jgi:ParB family chromosome partitioning protein
MPARSKGSSAKPAARGRPDKAARARKRLVVRAERRGLEGADVPIPLDAPDVASLVADVTKAGGAALGAYREPLSGRPILLATLPWESVEPTPFQRDLSPTHTKRLAQKIEESGAFLDPIIVVRGATGGFWTPNGRHRLAAAKVLGLRQLTALVSPDESLAFRILALNTEKAHNLKDPASRSSAWRASSGAATRRRARSTMPPSSRRRSCSRWASCTRTSRASRVARTARS